MINVWDVLLLILCCLLLRVAGWYAFVRWVERSERHQTTQRQRRCCTTNPIVAAAALIAAVVLAVGIWFHVAGAHKKPAHQAQVHVQTAAEAATAKLQTEAASKGLQVLEMMAPQEPDLMGFPNKQAVGAVKLEQPFDVCDGYLDTLANFKSGTNPDSVMGCGAEQIYAASSQGTIYTEVMITRQASRWEAGQWASPRRIRQLTALRTAVAATESQPASDYYVLDIMAMHQTFMACGKGADMVLYPIEADTTLGINAAQAYPAADLLAKLQPAAKQLAESSNHAPGN